MLFSDLGLIPQLLHAVQKAGYDVPTPIQEQAIPPALLGRDILGCAQTGTGKTAAFALPILQRLYQEEHFHFGEKMKSSKRNNTRKIRCLIMTPTRELAVQIGDSFAEYGQFSGLRSTTIYGGVSQVHQTQDLKNGVDIVIATPGRLKDLMQQGYVDLSFVRCLVLDEADRMLDMGFIHDVKMVLQYLPKEKQTLFFSATMPKEIRELVDSLLNDPVKIIVNPVSSTVDIIQQFLYKVDKRNKVALLQHLLETQDIPSALVFTRTKHGADIVSKKLYNAGIHSLAIHGNKSQNARQRALNGFKEGRVRVLVATDIAARGIDISGLSHAFNFDLPEVPETYVHRIGRTGRAGFDGTAISFCNIDELSLLRSIEKLTGKELSEVSDHPYPMEIFERTPAKDRAPRGSNRSSAGRNRPERLPSTSSRAFGERRSPNTKSPLKNVSSSNSQSQQNRIGNGQSTSNRYNGHPRNDVSGENRSTSGGYGARRNTNSQGGYGSRRSNNGNNENRGSSNRYGGANRTAGKSTSRGPAQKPVKQSGQRSTYF